MVKILIAILEWIIIAFIVGSVYVLTSTIIENKNKIKALSKKSIDIALDRWHSSRFSEEAVLADLSKYGVFYMTHDYNLEASTWILLKVMVAAGMGVISIFIPVGAAARTLLIAGAVILGYFLPDIVIRAANESDNQAMSKDILQIYTTLKIHGRAGVYITDSLIEAQRSVSNKRLKQALNEMNNNIFSSRTSIDEAVKQFNARFCNEAIDNLSVIILQSINSGQSVNLLEDLSAQIISGQEALLERKKGILARKLAVQQVLFFGLVVGMILYLVIVEMQMSLMTL